MWESECKTGLFLECGIIVKISKTVREAELSP